MSIFIFIAMMKNTEYRFPYTGQLYSFDDDLYLNIASYVFISNIALALGYKSCRMIWGMKIPLFGYVLSKKNIKASMLVFVYCALLAIGVPLFYITSSGMDYTDFVNYSGSNWGLVLMYVAASSICILFMQKRYVQSFLIAAIFLYFAAALTVRSFYLISLFPIILISYLNRNIITGSMIKIVANKTFAISMAVLALTFISISRKRELDEIFPESNLVTLMLVVMGRISDGAGHTGFASTEHFLFGAIAPFAQYISISPPMSEDVQEYFAKLVNGYDYMQVFQHYPALWYADSYSSFGWFGILFGLAWGVILYVFELLIRKDIITFSVFLPIYVWILYLIMRGAIGNSLLSISRPIYINAALYLVIYSIGASLSKANRKNASLLKGK